VRGKGSALALPTPVSGTAVFGQDPDAVVQLHGINASTCWTSAHMAADATKHAGAQFTAKVP
jgi:hypothetical protein